MTATGRFRTIVPTGIGHPCRAACLQVVLASEVFIYAAITA
jgi:hypothetical protein